MDSHYDGDDGQGLFIVRPRSLWQRIKWRLWGRRRAMRGNVMIVGNGPNRITVHRNTAGTLKVEGNTFRGGDNG